MNTAFNIVVPNWNGEAFLARGLSSLLISARATLKPFEFIVVDDASTDASVRIIADTFPTIRIIRNNKNSGFGHTANRGVRAARSPIIILANNDLVVKEDFVGRILAPFAEEGSQNLFGVSARTVNWTDGTPNHLNMSARFARGLIKLDYEDSSGRSPTLFLQGGACAFRRDIFLLLGGFASIFRPAYWEDYDISYRAAKTGCRCLYEPRALAYHLGKTSLMKALGEEGINAISARNYFYFTWLNLTDRRFLARHFLTLPFNFLREWLSGENLRLTKGFLKAVPGIGHILRERRRRGRQAKVSDRELLTNPAAALRPSR